MRKKSLSYAEYWRNCLADADLGKGALQGSDIDNPKLRPRAEWESGRVDVEVVQAFFRQCAEDVESVPVTIRPYLYRSRLVHGRARTSGVPEIVIPVVGHAVLDREGRLYPNVNTFVPRDILEPLDKGTFAVGAVSDLDRWLAAHEAPGFDKSAIGEHDPDEWHLERWQKYLGYCKAMFDEVAAGWASNTEPFQLDDRWAIDQDGAVVGASQHILALYDNIRVQAPSSPLFEQYASEEMHPREPCLAPHAGFSLRLGHSSDTHPLADAQRDALTHQIMSRHGEILGVNGPPGTGKTTMLLSVVASHWVRAALQGGNPPVIAAASTNNQAVTNIIDAFAKDFSSGVGPFAGRWLPGIKSFGAYFPSAKKEKQSTGKYQTRAFFSAVEEPDYFAQAKRVFLQAAQLAFPGLCEPSVQDICDRLHRLIAEGAGKLKAIEDTWPPVHRSADALREELGGSPAEALAARRAAIFAREGDLSACRALLDQWEGFLGQEPWAYVLLSWLQPVHQKRLLRAKGFLKERWPGAFPERQWTRIDQFSREIQTIVGSIEKELAPLRVDLERGENAFEAHRAALIPWAAATDCLDMALPPEARTLQACDKAADTLIRFPAFLYATHYWEARWLLEMDQLLPVLAEESKKKGAATLRKRWHRRMMLTPCVVSTFFMLPKEMAVSRYERGNFVLDYLYDHIDLLIVDEAGQVLPEVAGASFALAKRALVIGDTMQIEPIWSVKPQMDVGNLVEAGIMDSTHVQADYNRIAESGKTAASGSVMEIAQRASRYHYDGDLARGMYLYEHRRCYDEIVSYCNALCYHGKLIPKRGPRGAIAGLPAMGYLHVDGQCERRGGSRDNRVEAETIAEWIAQNQARLETQYSKKIHEIVGVVTPFGGQVAAITEACAARGIRAGKEDGDMTVGTVHSLQGAERILVIFSPTYSRDADGGFMDRSPSMLNVGVSRAKDHFLVFGDMSIFGATGKGTPRGLLASFLFAQKSNAIAPERITSDQCAPPV